MTISSLSRMKRGSTAGTPNIYFNDSITKPPNRSIYMPPPFLNYRLQSGCKQGPSSRMTGVSTTFSNYRPPTSFQI